MEFRYWLPRRKNSVPARRWGSASRLNGSPMGSGINFSLLISSEASCKADFYFFNSDSNLGTKGASGPQVRRGVDFARSFTEIFALSAYRLRRKWMSFDDCTVGLEIHEVEVKLTVEFIINSFLG